MKCIRYLYEIRCNDILWIMFSFYSSELYVYLMVVNEIYILIYVIKIVVKYGMVLVLK